MCSSQLYIGGLGRSNNPTEIHLEEAKVFPNKRIGCILSIGTGHMKPPSLPRRSVFPKFIPFQEFSCVDPGRAVEAIANDSEETDQKMLKRFAATPGVYFRFNVEQGMRSIKLGESVSELMAHTHVYLRSEDVKQKLTKAVVVIMRVEATLS